jgi:hypothetical protein
MVGGRHSSLPYYCYVENYWIYAELGGQASVDVGSAFGKFVEKKQCLLMSSIVGRRSGSEWRIDRTRSFALSETVM